MIHLATRTWEDTLAALRGCGRGRRECVVYWTGPATDPCVVDRVVHPVHSATPVHYELEEGWLHRFWCELASEHRSVRAQIHTHKFEAFHSQSDDHWPIVHTSGFLSLVVPRFAAAPVHVQDLFLAKISATGDWIEAALADEIRGLT